MNIKIACVVAVALMGSGPIFAQSGSQSSTDQKNEQPATSGPQASGHTDANGDLPGAKENERQSGRTSQAPRKEDRPGAMGSPNTPDEGTTPKGETPATGGRAVGQEGSSQKDDALPATDDPTTSNTGNVPNKDKDTNSKKSTLPSQKKADDGTLNPN
jgi:hypothetical protein